MTEAEIKRRFPNASAAFITANLAESTLMTITPSTDEDKLNKTERAYLNHLRALREPWTGIQNITLKLADDTRFTPDFAVLDSSGELRFIDVKGFQREDALIKIKVAARLFPWAKFQIVRREGTGWHTTTVKP